MTTKSTVDQLYRTVRRGTCINDGTETVNGDCNCQNDELVHKLQALDVISLRRKEGWNFPSNSFGTFCLHIAVTLDKRKIVDYIHKLGKIYVEVGANAGHFFCFTVRHRLSYIHTAVNHNRVELLGDVLQPLRSRALVYFDTIAEDVSSIYIRQGNSEMCKVFVQELQSCSLMAHIQLSDLLKKIQSFKVYNCVDVVVHGLAEHRQHIPFSEFDRNIDLFCRDKNIMASFMKAKLVDPKHVLAKAVREGTPFVPLPFHYKF